MRTLAFALLLLSAPWARAQTELHPEAQARTQAVLQAFLERGRVPGVSAGVASATASLALAAGVRERGREERLEPQDLLCAGSTGKTFVAAVVLQLVQEGKLSLDELAGERLGEAEWFARLPNADALTVESLLQHRTGLPRYEFQPQFTRDLLARPDHVWKPEELLGYVVGLAPVGEAGQAFVYSDTNYILLGMLVEDVTRRSLYVEVEERLLRPLGLTCVRPQDGRSIPGLIQGHAGAKDPFGFPDLVLDGEGRFCTNPQFEWAGGGFVSSGGDLARWIRALHAGDVLAPELRARMVQGLPARELGREVSYGLGAIVWKTSHGPAYGHDGFFPGYMSHVRFWPDHGIAVAVQVNTSEFASLGGPLAQLSEELLAAVLP